MKTTIMIQARTGSSRFPKKVLAKIEGKPLIWHVINRVKKVKGVQIILVTTKKKEDRILLKIARDLGITGFAGDTLNVLKRYYDCALQSKSDHIIRITGDCPLMDPNLIKKMLRFYNSHRCDYLSNTMPPTFPDGLDIEIFSFETLKNAILKAKLKSELEHVTPYIRKNKKIRICNYTNNLDLSSMRWTVDEKKDLKLVRKIYALKRPRTIFNMKEILEIIRKNPYIMEINSDIVRNEGYFQSLKKDRKANNL